MTGEFINGLGLAMTAINFLAVIWLGLRFERSSALDSASVAQRANTDSMVERRLSLLEQISSNAPSHRDLDDIRSRVGTVALDVAGVRERVMVISDMTRSIQKHLQENDQ